MISHYYLMSSFSKSLVTRRKRRAFNVLDAAYSEKLGVDPVHNFRAPVGTYNIRDTPSLHHAFYKSSRKAACCEVSHNRELRDVQRPCERPSDVDNSIRPWEGSGKAVVCRDGSGKWTYRPFPVLQEILNSGFHRSQLLCKVSQYRMRRRI